MARASKIAMPKKPRKPNMASKVSKAKISMSKKPRKPTMASRTATAKKFRKRTQAFTAAKDKKTRDTVKKNSETSPLLKLPIEVRNRIWGYVLGHQTVHIFECFRTRPRKLQASLCRANISSSDAVELFWNASLPQEEFRKIYGRHDGCCTWTEVSCTRCSYLAFTLEDRQDSTICLPLDLNVLQVCRQIYVEVNPILWSTTTWSFEHGQSMNLFLRNTIEPILSQKSLSYLKTLHTLYLNLVIDDSIEAYPPFGILHLLSGTL
ncbi:hypothetical protein BP5796_11481 [Coleophoma crateriformis]|uniref:DUF7730 domain-containing protein n=1 Tax=Coleophoma crateriformis TaxID=565419 RepID=A0A3D8QIH9_9HELO|nr:hypothetical protein BP5796_11481 [Coleophoma crateriformis]